MYWGDQYSEVVVIQLNMHAFSGGRELAYRQVAYLIGDALFSPDMNNLLGAAP